MSTLHLFFQQTSNVFLPFVKTVLCLSCKNKTQRPRSLDASSVIGEA